MTLIDNLVTRATSERNTSEDWTTIIDLCERANSSEAVAREIMESLSKRLSHKNVNVVLYGLVLVNSLIRNCGARVRREVSSRIFLDALVKKATSNSSHQAVQLKIFDFIQQWATEFNKDPNMRFLVDTYNDLKSRGYVFPKNQFQRDKVKTQAILLKEKEEEDLQLALALSLSSQQLDLEKNKNSSENKGDSNNLSQTTVLFQVRALYQFQGQDEGELSLSPGDIIDVYDNKTYENWWKGSCNGNIGMFPQNYVEKVEGTTSINGYFGFKSDLSNVENSILQNMIPKLQEIEIQLQQFDPNRDNLYDNERLLENYATIIKYRPQLMKLAEEYKEKQNQLNAVNNQFQESNSIYSKLVDASIIQYRIPQQQHQPQQQSQQSNQYLLSQRQQQPQYSQYPTTQPQQYPQTSQQPQYSNPQSQFQPQQLEQPQYPTPHSQPQQQSQYPTPQSQPQQQSQYSAPQSQPQQQPQYSAPQSQPQQQPQYSAPQSQPQQQPQYSAPQSQPQQQPQYPAPQSLPQQQQYQYTTANVNTIPANIPNQQQQPVNYSNNVGY